MSLSPAFKNLSRFFIYLAIVSPVVITYRLFFPFIYGKVLLFRTSVELAFIFFIAHLMTSNRTSYRNVFRQPLTIAVIVFAALFVVTALLGVSPTVSFWSNFERGEGGFQMLHYLVFFLLTAALFQDERQWKRLLLFSVIISLAVLTYGFAEWLVNRIIPFFATLMELKPAAISALKTFKEFILRYVISTGRTSGTLGNPAYLSAYLVFHLVFIAWLLSKEKQRGKRWLWGLLLVFEIIMYLSTETLAAIFGFLAAAVIIVVLYGALSFRRYHSAEGQASPLTLYYPYIGSLFFIIIFGGFSYLISHHDLLRRLEPRLWTWGSAISGVAERPVLGWGAEAFAVVFDKHYNPNHFGREDWFDRSHNLFLEHLIAGGVPLLLAYLSIFFFYYRRLRRSHRQFQSMWPVFAAVPAVYLIQGLTLFEVLPVYLALFLFLAFFINAAAGFTLTPETAVSIRPAAAASNVTAAGKPLAGRIIGGALMALTIWLIYYGNYLPLRKNMLLSQALRAETITDALEKFRTALSYRSPVGQLETYESAGRSFIGYFEGLQRQGEAIDARHPILTQIMALNDQFFAEIKPSAVGIKNYYVNGVWNVVAYKLTKDIAYLAKGKNIFEEARAIGPNRLQVLIPLLEIAAIEKDEETERRLAAEIKNLRPDLMIQFTPLPDASTTASSTMIKQ